MSASLDHNAQASPPLLSVVIPTYRRPDVLTACLASLAQQTAAPSSWELVLVADGDDDRVERVATRWRDRLALTFVRQPHGGCARARNTGAWHARGRYLIFTDDDCRFPRDWLARYQREFARRPESLVAGRPVNVVLGNPYSEATQCVLDHVLSRLNTDIEDALVAFGGNFGVPADAFRTLGGFGVRYTGVAGAEDRDFAWRWRGRGGQIAYARDLVVDHAHALTAASFARQHFNYGRGARLFHGTPAGAGVERPGFEPARFYASLLARPWTTRRGAATMRVAALVLASQAAHAIGYAAEVVGRPRPAPPADHARDGALTHRRGREARLDLMTWERILVRAPNWLGDSIMARPALDAIRDAHPRARITAWAPSTLQALYRLPPVDDVVADVSSRGHRSIRARLRFVRELRRRRFDAVILLQNGFEAAALARLARIPIRIGYARAFRGMLLTHAVPVPSRGELPAHHAYAYLELLRRAGIIAALPRIASIRLPRAVQNARPSAMSSGRWIGVAPGTANGRAKRWSADQFAEAAVMAARAMDARVAVFGAPGESVLCARVAAAVGASGIEARDLSGATLDEFLACAADCAVFVANDAGAAHVASALGVPTVVVFGPTDARRTGPLGSAATVVSADVECRPCLLHECPIDHRCMADIRPDRVAAAVVGSVASAEALA